jgi:hypothetical protein
MSTATLSSVREIEQAITSLRVAPGSDGPYQRTSVMTHIAWVPEEWVEAAEDVLAALAERHPSRTLALMPYPDADDGLEGSVEISCYPVGEGREICTETIRIRLNGKTTLAPESIVQPLFLPDLPVSLRWRGTPAFGERPFERLVDVADRLIVDSTEWPGLPAPYERLAGLFERVIVSDIAWARTSRWRSQLATMWPDIADVRHIRVVGTLAPLPARAAREAGARAGGEARRGRHRRRAGAVPARRPAPSLRPAVGRARPLQPRPDLRGRGAGHHRLAG